MTIWEVLGIAPTGDVRAIKKAYARQTRTCHPEEAPEEFQRLHAAFQEALRRAELLRVVDGYNPAANKDNTNRKVHFDMAFVMPKSTGDTPIIPWIGTRLHFDEVERVVESREALPDFDRLIAQGLEQKRAPLETAMRGLQKLHDDPDTKDDPLAWQEFLSSSAFYDLRHNEELLPMLTEFLTEQGDFPNDVWLEFCELYDFFDPKQRDEAHRELFELLHPRYRRAVNAVQESKQRKRNRKIKIVLSAVAAPLLVVLFSAAEMLWLLVLLAYAAALFAVPGYFHLFARVRAANTKRRLVIIVCCALAAVALVPLAGAIGGDVTHGMTTETIAMMLYCTVMVLGGAAVMLLLSFLEKEKRRR